MAASTPWIDNTIAIATSHTALTVYALLGGAILLALTLNIARGQRNEILGPSPFRGRATTRQRQIRERLALLVDQKTSTFGKLILNFLAVILFGLVVPSAILALGIMFFDWFVPGATALVGSAKASVSQALSFIAAQFTMGTDPNAPQAAHPIIAWGAIAYRYFIGGFVLMLLHLLYGIFKVSATRDHQIEVCRKLLAAAPPAEAAAHDMHGHDDHGHGGHGHDDHGHGNGHDAHGHDDHGHGGHGHDDHGHGDHGHGHGHGHEEKAHDDHGHGHDDHGHGGHGHDDHGHGHDDHGHGGHGHDDHGHGHDDHRHGHKDHGHKEHAHAH